MATSKLCDGVAGERAKKMKKVPSEPPFPPKKIRCAAVHFRKMSRTLKKCPLNAIMEPLPLKPLPSSAQQRRPLTRHHPSSPFFRLPGLRTGHFSSGRIRVRGATTESGMSRVVLTRCKPGRVRVGFRGKTKRLHKQPLTLHLHRPCRCVDACTAFPLLKNANKSLKKTKLAGKNGSPSSSTGSGSSRVVLTAQSRGSGSGIG